MAITSLNAPQKERAIEVTVPGGKKDNPKGVIIRGRVVVHGTQVRVPEEDAADLVAAGQAKYLDETKSSEKK